MVRMSGPRSDQILEPGVRVRLVLFQGARGAFLQPDAKPMIRRRPKAAMGAAQRGANADLAPRQRP
jgi:hypothetical protein